MSYKQARMGGRIRTILSELLLREIADPRLHGLTVTEVTLDQEMQYARVYISGFDEDPKEVMQGLKSANSFLRREVARRVQLRKAPELHFIWDETMQRGERINALIQSLDIPKADPADGAAASPVFSASLDEDEWDDESDGDLEDGEDFDGEDFSDEWDDDSIDDDEPTDANAPDRTML